MDERYALPLRALHWLMAALILGLIAVGWYMAGIPDDAPGKHDLYPWHKSFGMLVFLLALARVGVRWSTRVPPLPPTLPVFERVAAHAAHGLLYLGMILIPVSGYVMSMASGFGAKFFGVDVPNLIGEDKALAGQARELHELLPYALLAVIALHALGALKHRFFDKPEHDVLPRMMF